MCKQYVIPIALSNRKELATHHAQTVILTRIGPISQAPFSYSFVKDLIRFLYVTNIRVVCLVTLSVSSR
jgi:hypothetical protein